LNSQQRYRLVGVGLSNFCDSADSPENSQPILFD
jgi:hypothetical protein